MSRILPRVFSITSKIHSTCLSCEEPIRVGDSIWYTPGVGAWHSDCKAPRSLQTLWDEAVKTGKAKP